jgi:hypothetical protein
MICRGSQVNRSEDVLLISKEHLQSYVSEEGLLFFLIFSFPFLFYFVVAAIRLTYHPPKIIRLCINISAEYTLLLSLGLSSSLWSSSVFSVFGFGTNHQS